MTIFAKGSVKTKPTWEINPEYPGQIEELRKAFPIGSSVWVLDIEFLVVEHYYQGLYEKIPYLRCWYRNGLDIVQRDLDYSLAMSLIDYRTK